MKETQAIPLTVGVTGHRAIRPQDEQALLSAVRDELKALRALCPHTPPVMLNSLAGGGDLLCADAAEALGIPLIAVLPRARDDYERDFGEEELQRFRHHCERAERVITAPPTEPVPAAGQTRGYQFRQASVYIAAHSHVLLALWDGGPGTAAACGTAEAVDFALNGSFESAEGITPRSGSNEAVIHIFTPRGTRTEEPAGTVHVLGDWQAVKDILRKTEDFNRHARAETPDTDSRLPEGCGTDVLLERMETICRTAGNLSRRFARRYRRVLALLAAASALLTFAFLMYDEVQATWMILVCGVMLLAAWGCRRYAVRSDCHRRYLDYRVLAECLRVQAYLRYAGSRVQAAGLLSWTQQEETAWVLAALGALTVGEAPETRHDIRACWPEEQREYHRKASELSGRRLSASDRTLNFALVFCVGLYLLGVAYELLCGGLIFRPAVPVPDVELWRTVLKLLLGTASAVTLFVAGYYGRLSLPRVRSDHQKMERFYARLSAELERRGQTEELLTVLAREELIENGNWCSYQRDNTPDVSL